MSFIEAKYIATTTTTCVAIWLKKSLLDLKQEQKHGTTIYNDNLFTISITKNHVFHNLTKHIDTKYHFIKNYVAKGEIEIKFSTTNDQLAIYLPKHYQKGSFNT